MTIINLTDLEQQLDPDGRALFYAEIDVLVDEWMAAR